MSYRRKLDVSTRESKGLFIVLISFKLGPARFTIWREECAADDEDQKEYILNCAEEVADKLAEPI